MTRTYIEWLAELPWSKATTDDWDISAAAKRLTQGTFFAPYDLGTIAVLREAIDALTGHLRALRAALLDLAEKHIGRPKITAFTAWSRASARLQAMP